MIPTYVGDIVFLKKAHACGANEWQVLKTGIDIKLKCLKCGREIIMTRFDYIGSLRKVKIDGKWVRVRTTNETKRDKTANVTPQKEE